MLKSAAARDKQARPFEKAMRDFGEKVRKDTSALSELDSTNDRASFVRLYCARAEESGFHFTAENMHIAIQEQKNGSDWIIPGIIQRMIAERF